MKLLRSTLNTKPFVATFTYLTNDNEIKQFTAKERELAFIVDKTNKKTEDVIKDFRFKPKEIFTILSQEVIPLGLASKVKNQDDTINYHSTPQPLKKLLKNMYQNNKMDKGLVAWTKFAKKLQDNIDPYISSQLFQWFEYLVNEKSMALTSDGNIIGYKGLSSNFTSIHAGPGYVNGEFYDGNLDNSIGNELTMAREQVEANPLVACSTGLHVGSYRYARNFGNNVVVAVEVDPRDVVSIPTDSNSQKLRCAKYKVLTEVKEPLTELVYETNLDFPLHFNTKEENKADID